MEETIELREIFHIIRKRIWILVLITFLATATSGIISYFFMTPIYQASTQLLVNSKKDQAQSALTVNDIRFNLDIIATYIEVITSPRILDKVIQDLHLPLTVPELQKKIRVNTVKESQVISISVQDPDPAMAVTIANGIAATFQREIPGIMNVDNVQILAEAKMEAKPVPVKPKPALNMAIAFVVGMMTAIGLIFLLEYLDNTIKNEMDVERYLGLPVLGMIAPIDEKTEKRLERYGEKASMGGATIEA